MIQVACDICGRRYSLTEERLGQRLTCKSCDVEFEVCRGNEFDPDTPEFPEESPVEQEDSDFSWRQAITRTVGGICVVIGLGTMISLLFIDPRTGQAQAPIAAAKSVTIPSDRPAFPAVDPPLRSETALPNSAVAQPDPVETLNPVPPIDLATAPVMKPEEEVSPFVEVDEPQTTPNRPQFPEPRSELQDQARDMHERMRKQLEQLERNRPETNPLPPRGGMNRGKTMFGGVNYDGPSSIPSSNRPVHQLSDLSVGQIVQVQWGTSWWAADIMELRTNNTVRVKYRGWSQSEDVDLKRVQWPHQ